MDRKPNPAPFPVGTALRYVGPHRSWQQVDGKLVPVEEYGMIVTVTEVKPGRRGTLIQLRDEDGWMEDDNGEPILDTTRDAYSIYVNAAGNGRIIWPDAAHEWEAVSVRARAPEDANG